MNVGTENRFYDRMGNAEPGKRANSETKVGGMLKRELQIDFDKAWQVIGLVRV